VINEKGEVLLVLREDFRIWALPGGGLEPDETWEQAAVRETLEETGYQVKIKKYVGEYRRPQMSSGGGDIKRVFLAEVIGGNLSRHDKESVDVRWFPTSALPRRLFAFAREHVQDALADSPSPIVREQRFPLWLGVLWRIALLLRNVRNRIFFTNRNRQEQS
jgi:ADP-ribose pyrophosphatase YjhB (NUDIX family)